MSLREFYISQWTPLPAVPQGDQLKGQTVILTGANSGIGFEIAHHVTSLRPDRLILAVRDPKSATDALEKVLERSPGGVKVDLWQLDLADFASVKAFAKQCESLGNVDVVLNNAARHPGFHIAPMKKTVDGHEVIHQINILSQILLVCLLQPMLSKSASPRVVFTTSEVHAWAPSEPIANVLKEEGSIVNWADSEDKYDNTSRYFLSKLLLQMAIRAMLPLSTVNIVSVNPGLCRSNLGRDMQFSGLKGIGTAIWFLTTARSPETGARNVTHAMFAKDSYEYWSDCAPKPGPSVFLSSKTGMQASEQYWEEVKEVLEKVAPGCAKWL